MADAANIRSKTDSTSAYRELPSQEFLRHLFDYDPKTGEFTFRPRTAEDFERSTSPEKSAAHFNRTLAGKPAATSKNRFGYCVARVDKKIVLAHRLAWKMHYGADPDVIDHINGDPADNRICNLRSVTAAENAKNSGLRRDNKSGISGIKRVFPKAWGGHWRFTEAAEGRVITTRTFQCFGVAIKHRNSVLKAGGYNPAHGIRAAYASEAAQ